MKRTKTASADEAPAPAAAERQRVDKWLWHARLVRTRSAAAALADRGFVRVNGARIDASSRRVARGDVLTVSLGRVRILKVLGFAERREAAPLASALYEDLTPPPAREPGDDASRGGPRPTKRDRRALDRLRNAQDI